MASGKWLLETAKRESSRLSFQMARDAIHFTPGDIVEVMDNNYAGARLGGRIMSHSGNKITVDAVDSSLISEGDTMSIMGSDGKFVKYLIDGIADNVVTLKTMPAWVVTALYLPSPPATFQPTLPHPERCRDGKQFCLQHYRITA
jgi:predicted phage tail protein